MGIIHLGFGGTLSVIAVLAVVIIAIPRKAKTPAKEIRP